MPTLSADLPPVPPALLEPAAPWVFTWVVPLLGVLVILAASLDSIRRRRFTWGFLFLFNSAAIFWMETFADWGQMIIYSPKFAHHHLLEWFPHKTPYDPIFMPLAYSAYWTVHALVVLIAAKWLVNRFGWSLLTAILVLALPVNYVWDALVEASAAALGWWVYDPGFGPVVEFANGGKWTLLWTIGVMSVWPNLMAYWAGKPPVRTLNHIERFVGLRGWTRPKPTDSATAPAGASESAVCVGSASTLTHTETRARAKRMTKTEEYDALLEYEVTVPRWRFELARLGAWFVVFQVSFATLGVLPIVLMRVVTGRDSIYVP